MRMISLDDINRARSRPTSAKPAPTPASTAAQAIRLSPSVSQVGQAPSRWLSIVASPGREPLRGPTHDGESRTVFPFGAARVDSADDCLRHGLRCALVTGLPVVS